VKYYPVHSGCPPYARVNRVIEAAFAEHGRGNVQMPPKVYVTFGKTGGFRTMPAYLPAAGIAGVKIVNVHPNNRAHGLPTVMALTVIIDVDTGLPTALINATDLTRASNRGGRCCGCKTPLPPAVLPQPGAHRCRTAGGGAG